jgi:hypothetical protein
MLSPTNEQQALERERAELREQVAAYQRHLDVTAAEDTARRERLTSQIRRAQKRMAEVHTRLGLT